MSLNDRVSYGGELCTIRYVGEVTGTKGEWLGVEWDDPTRGKHDGEAGGKRYFKCMHSIYKDSLV
jgi:dynactin complex subunit